MKIIAFATLMLTLACNGAAGLPESDTGDASAPSRPDSATPDSVGTTQVVLQAPQTAEACGACNGDWGMHSLSDAISQTESCDCRTNDVGKRCTDGTDCQGMCVANSDNPEYDLVDTGPPARGFLVGRCSEFVTVFGCNALVDVGARDHGPVSVAESPPVTCVD